LSIRARKIADLLKREISDIIRREMKDPRVGFVTITQVKLTDDLKYAKVYVSVLPSAGDADASLAGLNHAKEFFRSELKSRVSLRYIPVLAFFIDDTLDYVEKIEQLIAKIKGEEK